MRSQWVGWVEWVEWVVWVSASIIYLHGGAVCPRLRFCLLGLFRLLGPLLFWDKRDDRDGSEVGHHLSARQRKALGSDNAD